MNKLIYKNQWKHPHQMFKSILKKVVLMINNWILKIIYKFKSTYTVRFIIFIYFKDFCKLMWILFNKFYNCVLIIFLYILWLKYERLVIYTLFKYCDHYLDSLDKVKKYFYLFLQYPVNLYNIYRCAGTIGILIKFEAKNLNNDFIIS